jgi:hypothetical protein
MSKNLFGHRLFCGAAAGMLLTLFATGIYATRHVPTWCELASTHIAAQLYAAAQK